jgi:hypothetical protein
MVESTEFMHLVTKYGVSGVPHTVINENEKFVGMLPDDKVVEKIIQATK